MGRIVAEAAGLREHEAHESLLDYWQLLAWLAVVAGTVLSRCRAPMRSQMLTVRRARLLDLQRQKSRRTAPVQRDSTPDIPNCMRHVRVSVHGGHHMVAGLHHGNTLGCAFTTAVPGESGAGHTLSARGTGRGSTHGDSAARLQRR